MSIATTIAVGAFVGLVTASPLAARGVLDQSTMPPGGYLSAVGSVTAGNFARAQTFVAGASGLLDTVTVAVSAFSSSDGRYRLSVEGVTAGGAPNGTVLARAIIDACQLSGPTDASFSPAAQLTAGASYALVLDPDPTNLPGASILWSQGQGAIVGGGTFTKHLEAASPAWYPSAAGPEAFSTYMSASAPAAPPRSSTVLTLSGLPNPVKRYEAALLTAHVTDEAHPMTVPAGTVRFVIDGQTSSPVGVDSSGDATRAVSWPTAGDHQVAVSFCPTDAQIISSDATTTVNVSSATIASTTTLQSAPAAPVAWEVNTLTAHVAASEPGAPIPTGTVEFVEEDGTPIGDPEPLDFSGTAALVATAGTGSYTVRALYSGDALYAPSEGDADLDVARAASVTSVESSANPATAATSISWLVDVSANPPSRGIPTGSVTVVVDGTPKGQFKLDDDGQVALGVSNPQPGSHNVSVNYSGDVDYTPSDGTLTQQVSAPPTAPLAAPTPPAATPPATAVTVNSLGARGLLSSLHLPARLTARNGRISLGTVANPPIRTLSVALAAAPSLRATVPAVTLGRAKVTVPRGKRRNLIVTLTHAGRRALHDRHSLRVAVRLRFVDSAGLVTNTTVTRTLTTSR